MNHCTGSCEHPVAHNSKNSIYASLKAQIAQITNGVDDPSCVPISYRKQPIMYVSSSRRFITILDAEASATSCGCRWILLHRSHTGLKGLLIINYLSEKSLLSDCFYLYMNISFLNRCHGFSFLFPSTMTDHNVQCYIYYHMKIFKKVFMSNRNCIIRVI